MAAVMDYFDNLEGKLCVRVNRVGQHLPVQRFFAVVSRLGDGACWAVFAVACLLTGRSGALPFVAQMAVTGGAGVAVYKLLKERLVRERPYVRNVGIVCGTAPLDRYSFPSGHTLHAVSFTLLLTEFEPLFAFICIPLAGLIAVSRVVLGLHYPSDVIAGALIGAALASLSLTLV